VTSRGNNRQDIFLSDHDRRDFLSLLARASGRFNLRIMAFCLMTNHYHLFLRTPDANLAPAMQWLNTTYTVRFHRRHSQSGHLLQGRYKAVLVADDSHWINLSIYIHLNPVRAGMVSGPAQYEWSSFRDYTRSKSRYAWLDRERALARYGPDKISRARRYRRHVLALSRKPPDFWEEFRNSVVLGSREAVKTIIDKYRPQGKVEAVPEFISLTRPQVELDQELKKLAAAFGVKKEDIVRRRRGFVPRLAAYYYLVEIRGVKALEVAELLGVSATAVSMGVKKCRAEMEKDKKLARTIASLTSN
jgi:REP element-mobilizing transposase RayT